MGGFFDEEANDAALFGSVCSGQRMARLSMLWPLSWRFCNDIA
jgi:hypothetical protein